MIGIGPDTNEVLHMLFSRTDLTMITGNHDEGIISLAKGEEYPSNHPNVKEHHQWILNRMDPSFIPKLEQLPRTINQTIDGRSILFTHYQYKKGKLQEHISKNPFSSIVEPSLENLESLFVENDEDLICFGHHHPLHYFRGDCTIYLNPGSLGCNNKPTAPYAIVTVSNKKIEINLKEAPYDNTAFLNSYQKLKVPERDFILRVFHGNQI